ncbi:sarcosine oxidase subunit delta [Enterovibrio norvegicus]|uniref:Sarcosine oxidase subunit delta n=2 Tax=Enterovibrio norvegicus TaxID=188144 RepID=A0A1I5KN09_9GAMM|nr:sarcosine oxidase subunit delta [Enterovibrio norvegicus]MCC4797737.1 sarcosine oxidase subunit delta [Enterovibrio norvegicus]OEE47061.1 sarcosine oxidase subunit delta [Enterovibrio norvegicus]OEF56474.1 sarcosine oxidase subunit delta [Enterovibrio norvegicus]PMH61037.1 sarcosine oxidase subunit delta [Enterovibrio norvegicus]PMI32752.1 sarcosine oxidase subunit delta [Enterovibrio norvegicus]
MLRIYCPYCEELREEPEFTYSGEAHIIRPLDPDALSDDEWGRYLFHRKNIKGSHREMWQHTAGCRKYFNMQRNTVTYDIDAVYKIGEKPPSDDNETHTTNGEARV